MFQFSPLWDGMEKLSPQGLQRVGWGSLAMLWPEYSPHCQLLLERPVVFVCRGNRKFHLCSMGQRCAQVFLMCAMFVHTDQVGNYLGKQRGCDLTACFRCFQSAEEAGVHCAAALERGVRLTDRGTSHLAVSISLSGCRKLVSVPDRQLPVSLPFPLPACLHMDGTGLLVLSPALTIGSTNIPICLQC